MGVSGPFVSCRYSDLGGISGVLQEVRELIEYPLIHPEVYQHLGIEPVSSIPANGIFLTEKLKNENKNAQRVGERLNR